MSAFDFATAQRIIFGSGRIEEIRSQRALLGTRTLVVTGRSQRHLDVLQPHLDAISVDAVAITIASEPTIHQIVEACDLMTKHSCQSVISLGGGSAVDAGKAIAALAANPGAPMDYLEVIGKGLPMPKLPFPFIAIPTTAGTGAEVTKNAVLSSPEHRVKVSLRSLDMLPNLAIVDSQLTHSLPRQATANAGIDALTQLIEPFLSSRANPLTDALCRAAIPRAARALEALSSDLNNPSARESLSFASLSSGLALANAGLGAVHGFAGPLGGMFGAPHGAICARLLPAVLKKNDAVATEMRKNEAFLERFSELGPLLTGNPKAEAKDGIRWAAEIVESFSVPRLSSLGILQADFPEIVQKSQQSSSMKGNPFFLEDSDLTEILSEAF